MGSSSTRGIHEIKTDRIKEATITHDGNIIFSLCDGSTHYKLSKKLFFQLLKKYQDNRYVK